MTLPTLTIKLDDGTGTFPYTIPSNLVLLVEGGGLSLSRGRGDEQSAVTAGVMNLTLNNSTGQFTLGSAIPGTAAVIAVDTRIRVIETIGITSLNRFTGYVKAWPVAWPAVVSTFATCTITASDAQARGERRVLRSVVEEEFILTPPSAYYTLGEPTGSTVAADSSGSQAATMTMTGTGTPVVFGSGTGPTDGLTAATFSGTGMYLTPGFVPPATAPLVFTMACWFATTGVAGNLVELQGWRLWVSGAGKVEVADGAGVILGAGPTVTDGLNHLAMVTSDGSTATLYVDGVAVGTDATLSVVAPTQGNGVGRTFVGTISHVAMWSSTAVSAASAASIYSATLGESGTARITRLAGYAGIPVGTLDASLTNVPVVALTGNSAWPSIQDVTDAEVGLAYIDGSGNLRFINRNAAPAKTTPDVTFSKDYVVPGAQPTVDDQALLNYLGVTAQGTGIEQVVRNTTSETSHGRYSDSKTYLVSTDAEAIDRGNWIIANHAEPTVRYGQLTLNLFKMTAADAITALGIEPGTWLRITSMPTQTPGGATADLNVEGIAEALGENRWDLTLNVVSRSLYTAWILGDSTYSVLGSTTKLFV